jgi:hypothetical protein
MPYLILQSQSTCLSPPGADSGFQVRGGGALKKIAPSGGSRENFGGFSCEKSRFCAPLWIRPCPLCICHQLHQ